MIKIINTTELQQQTNRIVKDVQHKPHIIINKGRPKAILLPYFEGCDDFVEDYWRAINGSDLKNRYRESLQSKVSDLNV